MEQRFNKSSEDHSEPEWRTALFFHSEGDRRHPLSEDPLQVPKIEISDSRLASLLLAEMQAIFESGDGSFDDLHRASELYRALPKGKEVIVPDSLKERALDAVLGRLAAGEVSPFSAFLASPFSWGVNVPEQRVAECATEGLERRWREIEALTSLAVSNSEKTDFALHRLPSILRDMAYLSAKTVTEHDPNRVEKLCCSLLTIGSLNADNAALKLVRLFLPKEGHEGRDLNRHVRFRLREALREGGHVTGVLQLADELSVVSHDSLLKAVKVWSAVHWNKGRSYADHLIEQIVRSEVFDGGELLDALSGATKRVARREMARYDEFLKRDGYDTILHALSVNGVPASLTAPAYGLSLDICLHSAIEVLPSQNSAIGREAKRIYGSSSRRLLIAEEDEGVTGLDFIELPLSSISSSGSITADGRRYLEHRKIEARTMDTLKLGEGRVEGARLTLTKRDGKVIEYRPDDIVARMMELELLSTELYGAFFGNEKGHKESLLSLMEGRYLELLEIAELFNVVCDLVERDLLQSDVEIDRTRYPGHEVTVFEGATPHGEIVFTVPMGFPENLGGDSLRTIQSLLKELRTLTAKASNASY